MTYENIVNSFTVTAHNTSNVDVWGTIVVECKNPENKTVLTSRSTFFDSDFVETVASPFFLEYLVDCKQLLPNGRFSKIMKVSLDDDISGQKAGNLIYTIE